MSKPILPVQTVVIVFDDPEQTAVIKQIIVSHESIEVQAVFDEGRPAQKFAPVVSKKMIASRLGKKKELTDNLLQTLSALYRGGAGDIVLDREAVETLLQETGESQIVDVPASEDTITVPSGASYEDTEEDGSEITFAALNHAAGIEDDESGGAVGVTLLVTEEDAA